MEVKRGSSKGFSLIELIIAVAILVVLSGLLAPQLIKYVERSREAKDMQTLDSVYVAVNTALTNEEAYQVFTDENGPGGKYGDMIAGMTLTELFKIDDSFTQEVKATLEKSDAADVKLVSKRARVKAVMPDGTMAEGTIMVQVKASAETDGVSGLYVGVYAGGLGKVNGDFKAGYIDAKPNTNP
ncbi:prepilin-type N-terminal cleavage/methylation domain-containing protein [Clostridium sp. AM58-1XD]|uniref:type II secretion system protein n=1 Tax=Clostridium sp. AM58-1XD TaxID=2292307 RepID=UPI000E5380E7|nr:prepilin-type N-terminal cleavage/methylation domain-containing protein [Clostridium sp. AM58-1XD]RGZ00161.1 prepilin-type N-terminal cleavage/methylation domain-containing protein [Clostridium sp. AM58-1XD]